MHKMDQNVKNFFTEDEPTAAIYKDITHKDKE